MGVLVGEVVVLLVGEVVVSIGVCGVAVGADGGVILDREGQSAVGAAVGAVEVLLEVEGIVLSRFVDGIDVELKVRKWTYKL